MLKSLLFKGICLIVCMSMFESRLSYFNDGLFKKINSELESADDYYKIDYYYPPPDPHFLRGAGFRPYFYEKVSTTTTDKPPQKKPTVLITKKPVSSLAPKPAPKPAPQPASNK